MEKFEHRVWSLRPSAKLRLSSGILLPMHSEVVSLSSPVMAALLQKGKKDKDHCIVCTAQHDWTFSKDAWLLWLACVYAHHLGPLSKAEMIGAGNAAVRSALLLTSVLKCQISVADRLLELAWGAETALLHVSGQWSTSLWTPVRWLSATDRFSYCWHVDSGTNEHRWCETIWTSSGIPEVRVLRLSPSAAAEFRACYLRLLMDILSLVPLVPCYEVVGTVKALLSCEVSAGHTDLLNEVAKVCSRSPVFLKALIKSTTQVLPPSYSASHLPEYIITELNCCKEQPGSIKTMSASACIEAAPYCRQDATSNDPLAVPVLHDNPTDDTYTHSSSCWDSDTLWMND